MTSSPGSSLKTGKLSLLLIIGLIIFGHFDAHSADIISQNSNWKYYDSGGLSGSSWTTLSYNDASWSSGNGILGFGDGPTTTLTSGNITYYFRKTFNITDTTQWADLDLDMIRDDGAVVYLNGTEVWRDNMPSGTITSATLASSTVSGSDESTYFNENIANNLLTGSNIIAVEIHQRSAGSSDISFDLSLVGNVPSTSFVDFGSTWKYDDNGGLPSATWTELSYDDSGWSSGPAELGYGDGDEATEVDYGGDANDKYVTTYFRQAFTAAGFSPTDYLELSLIRDDGAVVYINGTEVWRIGMPTGTISNNTLANTTIANDDESTAVTELISASVLNDGNNVVAIEIHQVSVSSSDITMDFEMATIDVSLEVERGPYLQTLTQNGITVKWRTNIATTSQVNFGLAVGYLGNTVSDTATTTEHEVTITGLSPGSRFYYSVGTMDTTLEGDSTDYYFRTAPQSDFTGLTRAWVLGDAGTANGNQRNVRDAYYNYVGSDETDMILMLGDNAYNDGTDDQYQTAVFQNMYEEQLRKSVTWSCPGNHDMYSASSTSETGPYYDIFTFPKAGEAGGLASGTEAYYSWDYGQIHFISMDSDDTDRDVGGSMLTWLTNDLAATSKNWIVVIFHHPPYTKGSHDSDNSGDSGGRMEEMRENALPILESYGVDLVLSGHSHSYERSYLLKGHHDVSGTLTSSMILDSGSGNLTTDCSYKKTSDSGDGAVYITAGSSGKVTGTLTAHPAMYAYLYQMGSVVMEVEKNRMDVKFINDSGVESDYFTIDKDMVNAAIDTTIRDGESIALTASWLTDFTWSPGSQTSASITVSPSTTTQYIVTNASACMADTFNVTVIPACVANEVTINTTTCDPDSAGTTVITLPAYNGCDSVITTNTTALVAYDITIEDSTCNFANVGTQVFNYTAISGCDSIVSVVTEWHIYTRTNIRNSTCDDQLAASTIQHFAAHNGCDSVVTTETTYDGAYAYFGYNQNYLDLTFSNVSVNSNSWY